MTEPVDLNAERAKRKHKRKPPPREGWESHLQLNSEGNVKKSLANVMTIMGEHPDWQNVLAYDAFSESIVTTAVPPTREQDRPSNQVAGEWSEADSVRAAAWLAQSYFIDVGPITVEQAVQALAHRRIVHPVRDYLHGLKWDATQRLPSMLSTYFGSEKNPYTAAIGTRYMIGAVARIEQPACQMDTMLVCEGDQGILKSSALRALAGQWFADSGLSIGDKDSYQSLRRVWIYEIPEFASIKAARDIERVKAFLTSRCDHYRPSYGRRAIDVPRQCVFAGSTNESEYLLDKTGARRFWPFNCGRIDLVSLERDRDQLWAEAVTRYESKERWWVDSLELRNLCEAEQADRTPVDPWVPIVEQWLADGYVLVPDGNGGFDRVNPAEGLTTTDVLRGAISMHKERIDRAAEMRAGQVLRHFGWERRRVRIGSDRAWKYFGPPLPVPTGGTETSEGGDNQ